MSSTGLRLSLIHIWFALRGRKIRNQSTIGIPPRADGIDRLAEIGKIPLVFGHDVALRVFTAVQVGGGKIPLHAGVEFKGGKVVEHIVVRFEPHLAPVGEQGVVDGETAPVGEAALKLPVLVPWICLLYTSTS